MKKIIFVCTANICRSVMAEYIAKDVNKNPKLKIDSAGICVIHKTDMDNNTKVALHNLNIFPKKHISKSFTAKMLKKNNIVITMTKTLADIIGHYSNVFCLKEIIGTDIEDIYKSEQKVYDETSIILKENMEKIIKKAENYFENSNR